MYAIQSLNLSSALIWAYRVVLDHRIGVDDHVEGPFSSVVQAHKVQGCHVVWIERMRR